MNFVGNFKLAGTKAMNWGNVNSPEIMLGFGLIGLVTAGVGACIKSITEVHDIVEDVKNERYLLEENKKIAVEDKKKETAKVYLMGSAKILKAYAPHLLLAGISVMSIIGSNRKLNSRLASVAGAYAEMSALFDSYRKRVIDKYGEDADYRLLHGIEQETIEVTETDESGKTKTKKKRVDIASEPESLYMRYFVKSNPEYKSTDVLNEYFFECVKRFADEKLKRLGKGGFVTLNEVYHALNLTETPMGMVVGWRYDENNPTGDNYVDIKYHKVYLSDEFGNFEEAWALDFNVDGNIYKEMAERDINTPLSGDIIQDMMQFPKLVQSKMKGNR